MANTLSVTLISADPSDVVKVAEAPPPASSSPSVPDSVIVPIPYPGIPSTAATAPNNDNLARQEKDLGKAVLGLAIPIAMGVLTAGKNELSQSKMSIVLILVSLGFAAILSGIQLKDTFPEFARILEALGIALVAISFFAIIASFLPPETSWVPVVCMALCLLPFGIAVWRPP